ncbi:MAG: hypothetical protein ACRDVM_10215 [Acidimicrobiia bacterium]
MLGLVVERPNWELSNTHELAANLIFGAVAGLALAFMVYVIRKERQRYPLFMFLGAGLSVFYEPINNVLGLVPYPESGQVTWIETFGRQIPTYIGFVYFFYFSATILWLTRRIRAGVTARQWARYYAVGVVLCTSFELIPIHLGWWKYYGDHQALRVLDFPMWWWFANPMCLFAMATLFHFLRERVITDRLSPLFVPLYPVALFAMHGSAAIPVYTYLNSSTNQAVGVAATLLTIGWSVTVIWITSRLVAEQGQSVPAGPVADPVPRTREVAAVS